VELFRQFASVGLVLGLAGLAAYWLRKGAPGAVSRPWAPGGGPKKIQLLQRLALTPQHYLCVVRVDGREWIVGVFPNGMTVLEQTLIPAGAVPAMDRREQTT
jgi:flagellar biogenesis protein FliO